jgi:hypothetical protein
MDGIFSLPQHDAGFSVSRIRGQAPTNEERVTLLSKAGRWVVSPGRAPMAEKVRLVIADALVEGEPPVEDDFPRLEP